ncbi:MAG: hypothetical protein J7599_07895 [Niabella sp.]|nr:hypothetical protein [Niabella sp.]
MKKITCELCGSSRLAKLDEAYVCQNCNTKYSVEEAKKMVIDGVVEVTGRVEVDSSGKLSNLYQIARRAKNEENAENAARYYDMILIEDPTSWEAAFYVVYFKAVQCKIAYIQSAAVSVNNCIDAVIGLIKDKVADELEQEQAINEVAGRVIDISNMLCNAATNHYNGIDTSIRQNYMQEYLNNVFASFRTVYYLGNVLENSFGDKQYACESATAAWKAGVSMHSKIVGLLSDKEGNKSEIARYVSSIKKYNPTYQAPEVSTSSGCYIATAVYGSYDCPQVWALRRYRDDTLAQTWYGRAFIRFYYATSPTIVKWFGKTEWFNSFFKKLLDGFIEKLKK